MVILALPVWLMSQAEFPSGAPLFPEIIQWHEAGADPEAVSVMRALGQSKDQPWQFALPLQVSLNPSNSGFIVSKGNETVWVLPVSSKGALSLNLILAPFNLPEGAYLYLYDYERNVIRGAYTRESSPGALSLPVLPLPGDRMVLECHFPGGKIPANAIGVKQVAHDFAGFFQESGTKDGHFGASGDCEIDISCSADTTHQKVSRSVVRLLVAGTELCTGVLINTTGPAGRAYILTARHCIETEEEAANTIFVFSYRSPYCGGPDMSNMQSLSGATLRAYNEEIDFSLVELLQYPSILFRPYLAGWDITQSVPSSTFTIHHPQGDVMKLTIDKQAPQVSSYPLGGFAPSGFWRILKWESGSTEPGSSGGPLFDPAGRVRGTLTGGAATCSNPANDYYARLDKMFDLSAEASRRLRPWLDPAGTNASVINGRDPYFYNLLRSDTIGSMPQGDSGTMSSYPLPGWGLSTGHNSDSIVGYAEYFPFHGSGELLWLRVRVAAAEHLSQADSVRFFIWGNGPVPGTMVASKAFRMNEFAGGNEAEINFGRPVKRNGPFYAGYIIYYRGRLTDPQPLFAIAHSDPWPQQSQNSAFFYDGTGWKPFTGHPTRPMPVSLAINAVLVESSIMGIQQPSEERSGVQVLPNPFSGEVTFRISGADHGRVTVEIYDHAGRTVHAGEYGNIFPGDLTIELPGLPAGIYHYSLKSGSVQYTGTIIKHTAR